MSETVVDRRPWPSNVLRLPAPAGWDGVRAARLAAVLAVLTALVVTVLVARLAGVHSLQDDAAQYVSTARHLLEGRGLATDILYYESQLAQRLPAAQTVWPPGLPAAAAATAWLTGLDAADALVLLGLLAHAGTAWLLGVLVHRVSDMPRLGWFVGMAWLLCVPAWLGAARGLADPPYQFFGLAAGLALWSMAAARGFGRTAALAAAALLLAGALGMRYQAVALFVPLAVAAWVARGGWPGVRAAMLVCLPATALLGALFARNLAFTGSLTGGASTEHGQTLAEVAARLEWLPHPVRGPALTVLVLAALAAGAAALWIAWRARPLPAGGLARARAAVEVYGLSAFSGNVLLLLLLSLGSTVYVIEMRYVLAAGLFVLPVVAGRAASRMPWPAERVGAALLLAALVQALVLWPAFRERLHETPNARIEELLGAHTVGRRAAIDWLREQAAAGAVVLSSHPHGLALATGAATLGIPVPVYVTRPYDDAAIRAVAQRHAAGLLVAFREMPTWVYRDPVNRMLDDAACPAWTEPLVDTRALFVARLNPAAAAACGSPDPSPRD